jgi:glutamyl-tRNA synthetase
MLRFEDTDSERSSRAFEESILDDLLWLGINPDGEISRQTERLERYVEILFRLERDGFVYPCFCPAAPDKEGHGPYPGTCRNIPPDERRGRIESGESFCRRFAALASGLTFRDRLRGDLTFDVRLGGDFVLTRADGTPTYTFAVVVDDHDFKVTHVIRGEEHIPNTPRQELIYRALGWEVPEWVHIPMVLDSERHKLSKRSGAISVSAYRDDGWSAEALVSYMATLSWSGAPTDKVSSPDELASLFDIDSVALDSPVHDPERMRHFGRLSMRSVSCEKLLGELGEAFSRIADPPDEIDADRAALLGELLPECASRRELSDSLARAFEIAPVDDELGNERTAWMDDLLDRLAALPSQEWFTMSIKNILKKFQKERALEGKIFYHALRATLTGRDHGAPLALLMACLGRKIVIERLGKR